MLSEAHLIDPFVVVRFEGIKNTYDGNKGRRAILFLFSCSNPKKRKKKKKEKKMTTPAWPAICSDEASSRSSKYVEPAADQPVEGQI